MAASDEQIARAMRNARAAGDTGAANKLEQELIRRGGSQTSLSGSLPINLANLNPLMAAMNIAGVSPVPSQISEALTLNVPAPAPVEAGAVSAGRTADRLMQESIGGEGAGELMRPLEEEYPAATIVGGALPYMAVPVGSAAGLAGGALTKMGATTAGRQLAGSVLADAALTGGVLGALDVEGSAVGGALGGAGGAVAGNLISRVANPLTRRLGTVEAQNVANAERLGLELTPGEATGSFGARAVEASLRSTPLLRGGLTKVAERRQDVMNRIAAKAIGEDADNLGRSVLGKAARRIGAEFDAVRDSIGEIPIQSKWVMDQMRSVSEELTMTPQLQGLENRMFKIIQNTMRNRSFNGKDLMALSSDLGKISGKSSDGITRLAAGRAKDRIDDVIMRNLDPDMAQRLQQARSQYKSLMQVEKATNPSTGNISGAQLANRLKADDVWGFRRGEVDSDLYNMAAVAQQFKDFPNSWTAERLQTILGLGGIGALSAMEDPSNPLLVGAAALAGSRAYPYAGDILKRTAMSPQARDVISGLAGRVGMGLVNQ